MLGDALADDCSYEVVQSVHEQLCGMIEEHKTNKEVDPLAISKSTVKSVLKSCGVSDSNVSTFDEKFDAEFGADAKISPRNIIDTKKLEVRAPDVTIQVNPERSDLLETRMINGSKYILIRVDAGVEVNGVSIHIS